MAAVLTVITAAVAIFVVLVGAVVVGILVERATR